MWSIADKVASLRAKQGWTLKQLSDRSGISMSYLSAIERGIRPNPSFQSMIRLANALDVPLSFFVDPEADAADHRPSASTTSTGTVSPVPPLVGQLATLYDDDMQRFIISEASRPYVSFAKQLADSEATIDASLLLQMIAEFMKKQEVKQVERRRKRTSRESS